MLRAFPSPALSGRAATLACLVLVLTAPPLAAQVADAVIEVDVADETGQALPGVTVTVSRPETGFTRVASTGESGTARVPALSPGTYRVQFDLQGFAQVVQDKLVLRVGQTARLPVTMKVAAVQETVTVTAEVAPLVDVYKTDSSTNIVPEQIQDLPVQDRDFQRLAFLTPGVQRERGGFRFVTGGPVIGAGGNASQSTILVDGVDFTDPTLGLARARFSQDAIGEFRVIANRFDTEVGGSAGGALSIVTKAGTNDLRGSLFGFYRADELRAKGTLEQNKVDFSRWQYGFTLGGPFVKDQTHFFLSFEQIDVNDIALFRPGGAFTAAGSAFPPNDFEHPTDQSLVFGSVTHKISPSQQLGARFAYERYREENFRVGGNQDLSYGQELNRDNWNLTLSHNWAVSQRAVNALHVQVGSRRYEEPLNSTAVSEWFSSGNTLRIGGNIVGALLGDSTQWEVRDTLFLSLSQGRGTHDIKLGFAFQNVDDRFFFPVFQTGLLLYATDTRALPIAYTSGTGSGDATIRPDLISGFIQDDFRPRPDLTLSVGLRYDLDTAGNNPDFTHSLLPGPRGKDTNNFQPRFGFSWDVSGKGSYVVRGGVGLFTGRFLLVPAFAELQQNGEKGRVVQGRLNGLLVGIPALALNPNNPQNTGIALPKDSTLLDDRYVNPRTTQASLGFTAKLGDTGLYFDLEGIYAKGVDEIIIRDKNFAGNAAVTARRPARLNPLWNQVNVYTNEGRSEYKALVASVNGPLKGGHLITASVTLADKRNVNDDFSPEFPFGYPSDPSDIDAEYGRSRADERFRLVLSGVFRLPGKITVAPIYEYGSGQPWTRRLGYDFNGDGKNSDRASGVPRNSEDGPSFSQLSLRVTKRFPVGERGGVDVIAEAFNLFNTRNDNVAALVESGNGAEFLSGPTIANPSAPFVPNPNFGRYTGTFAPLEVQLGLRLVF